jgi:dimethylaniline monooxygenase (N-oxide forming)
LKYFNDYTNHFKLKDYIQFKTEVKKIEKNEDKTWSVTILNEKQEIITSKFDSVMICSGHHWSPRDIHIEGEEDFKKNGLIFHSHYYKNNDCLKDKTVVIIGTGNTGCDLAVESSKVAKNTYLVSRSGCLGRINNNQSFSKIFILWYPIGSLHVNQIF